MHIRHHAFGFELTDALRQHVERQVGQSLRPFAPRVVSATVRLDDVNGTRGGVDKRCSIVIALARRGTVVARAVHADMYAAIEQASQRLRLAAQRALSRRNPQERQAAHFPGWNAPEVGRRRRFPSRVDAESQRSGERNDPTTAEAW